jgi:beta-N-acetylhexosaminidase
VSSRLFCVGLSSLEITPAEREILRRDSPGGVILFRRNIESVEQVRALTQEIRSLPGRPLLCVDQEGGAVDRFREMLGPMISFGRAAQLHLSRRAGELAGEACATLGFDMDLAPVVDRRLSGAGERILAERAAAADPLLVIRAATEFLQGLHSRGVGGCVKHFPGLGRARLDTHRELPVLADDTEEATRDLAPFEATMQQAGAVMISHAAGSDGVPASLSPGRATDLLRRDLGFTGAALSDDLEMGALAGFGGLPQRCAAAARAGCDLLLVCSRIEIYAECLETVMRDVPEERRAEAASRLESYRRHLATIRETARTPDRSLAQLIADITELRETPGPRF